VAVRQGHHILFDNSQQVVVTREEGELAGETAVVWTDCRDGERDGFIQVLTEEGEPKFPENGLKFADSPFQVWEPRVSPCADGGWFVAWIIRIFELNNNFPETIFITKIDSEGEIIWGEELSGIMVVEYEHIRDYHLIPDNDLGLVITVLGDDGDTELKAFQILADGEISPDWPEDGVLITANQPDESNAISDALGGVYSCWIDSSNIFIQHISAEGELHWDEDGLPIDLREGSSCIEMCPDGEGGAFLAWINSRDIYAQRISPEGELYWGDARNPVEICATRESDRSPGICKSEQGSAVIVWRRQRVNIFACKISGDEDLIRNWGDENGVPVFQEGGGLDFFSLCPDGAGGVFISGVDNWTGFVVQRINENGNRVFDDDLICNDIESKQDPGHHLTLSNATCTVIWQDNRTGSPAIYRQQIDRNGEITYEQNGERLVGGFSYSAFSLNLLVGQDDRIAMLWMDDRNNGLALPYLQVGRDTGNSMEMALENHGVPLLPENMRCGLKLKAINSADDNIIIVWEDDRNERTITIYSQKVNWEGESLWDREGVQCADPIHDNFDDEDPLICTDGAGGAIFTWQTFPHDSYADVLAQRLDANGNRLWGDQGIQLTRADENEIGYTPREIVSDNENGAVIVYACNNRETGNDYYIQRVNGEGEALWGEEEGGITLVNADQNQYSSDLIKHPGGYVVCWRDDRNSGNGQSADIYAQFISEDGDLLWQENGAGICTSEFTESEPSLAIDDEANIWITWRATGNARHDIYCQKLSSRQVEDGNPVKLFEGYGIAVTAIEETQLNPVIKHDGSNGMWFIWTDYRNSRDGNIFGTHLNPEGQPYRGWDENGEPICESIFREQLPQVELLNNGSDGIVIAWEDIREQIDAQGRGSHIEIYTQHLDNDMASTPEENFIPHPSSFILTEPFPNPFNSTTTIEYALPYASVITLSLYNLSGQRVETLVDGRLEAGVHQVMLDAGDLASGLYFVKLEGVGRSVTQKIMLVK